MKEKSNVRRDSPRDDEVVTRGILMEVLEEKLEEKLEQKLDQKLDEKFDAFAGMLKIQFDHIDHRFERLEGRMDHLEQKVDGMNAFLYRHIELSDTRFFETQSTLRIHDLWIKRSAQKLNIPYPTTSSRK